MRLGELYAGVAVLMIVCVAAVALLGVLLVDAAS